MDLKPTANPAFVLDEFSVWLKSRRVHFPWTKRGKTSILSRRKSEMKRSEEKKHLKEKKKRRRRHRRNLSCQKMSWPFKPKKKTIVWRCIWVSPIFHIWWFSPLPSTRKLEGTLCFFFRKPCPSIHRCASTSTLWYHDVLHVCPTTIN